MHEAILGDVIVIGSGGFHCRHMQAQVDDLPIYPYVRPEFSKSFHKANAFESAGVVAESSSVYRLLGFWYPFAIIRAVSLFVIVSLNAKAFLVAGRCGPRNKGFKRLGPLCAYRNALYGVVDGVFSRGAFTSLDHSCVGGIKSMGVISMLCGIIGACARSAPSGFAGKILKGSSFEMSPA